MHRLVVAAVWNTYNIRISDFSEAEGIHFALDDVAVLGVLDSVQVVGNLFAVGLGLTEALVARAELGGYEFAVSVVVEVDAEAVVSLASVAAHLVADGVFCTVLAFNYPCGHPVGAVGDPHNLQCLFRYAAFGKEGYGLCVHLAGAGFGRAIVGAFGLLGTLLGEIAEPRLLAHPRLLLFVGMDGSVAVPAAVVALELSCLKVHGQTFLVLVLAAFGAFWAKCLYPTRRAARIASEVYAFGFPTYHNWSD